MEPMEMDDSFMGAGVGPEVTRRFLPLVFSSTDPYGNVMSSPVSTGPLRTLNQTLSSGGTLTEAMTLIQTRQHHSPPRAAPPGGALYGNNIGHGQQSQACATYDAAHFNHTIVSTGSKVRGGLPLHWIGQPSSGRLCEMVPLAPN
jgi:hypothetical protein